jgi:putative membrane protein
MRYFLYVFWLIIVILGVVFASLNASTVTLHYYVGTVKLSLAFLLLCTLIIGLLLGMIASAPSIIKLKIQRKSLKSKLKSLEKEVSNLRAMPFTDQER